MFSLTATRLGVALSIFYIYITQRISSVLLFSLY
jgi:hypothetical protein